MIGDALGFDGGERLSYDVCVVGAGPAGVTLALALRDKGLRVALLESGGLVEEDDTQALYRGHMSGLSTWQLHEKRWRLLGGSSARWAGWCMPLFPDDLEARAWIPHSGWPLRWDDLAPWYVPAQARLELGDFLYDGAAVAEAAGRTLLLPDNARIQNFLYQYSRPTRFGSRYRNTLDQSADVDVWLHANLVEIVLEDDHDAVDHLACATLDDTRFTVEAGAYVLALGGIETVRVLLASNAQRPEGVANGSDALGRYFMEHPHYNYSAAWVANGPPDLTMYEQRAVAVTVGDATLMNIEVRGVLGLTAATRAEHGLLGLNLSIHPAEIGASDTGDVGSDQIEALLRAESSVHGTYRLSVRAEQSPNPDSRITLRPNDRDALGMPRVDLNWQIRREDEVQHRRSLQILGAELAAAGLGRVWIPHQDEALTWRPAPGGHHMGTTRMSASPADGVVDADLRCHEVDNLYIASSSVFPTGGHANPTLTIVALAERLAAHLADAESR